VGSYGSNEYGQRDLADWTYIAAVAVNEKYTAGLREDGTVLVAGDLENKEDVEDWENIIAIAAGDEYLFGLTMDGSVVTNVDGAAGSLGEATNIRAITVGSNNDLFGLNSNGNIVFANYELPELSLGWNDVECISVGENDYIVGIKSDGTVVVDNTGSETYGELDYQMTTGLLEFQDIVQVCIVNGRVLGVSAYGTLYMTEDERFREHIAYTTDKYYFDLFETAKEWSGVKGILCYGAGVADHLLGFKEGGDILCSSIQYGNAELEDMFNLSRVLVMDSFDKFGYVTIVGVQYDGNVLAYCSSTTAGNAEQYNLYEQKCIKEIGAMFNITNYNGEAYHSYGAYYLNDKGKLYIQKEFKYEEQSGNYLHAVKFKNALYNNKIASFVVGVMDDGKVKIFGSEGYLPPVELYEAQEWSDITQVACLSLTNQTIEYTGGIVGLKSDGTLVSVFPEDYKEYESESDTLKNVASIYNGYYCVGAILQDGTAAFLKYNVTDDYGQFNTLTWTDLTQLAMGMHHTVGLRSDGTVYACGSNLDGQCDVSDWEDIVYIEAGKNFTLGVKADGTLLVAGSVG
jgi:hypothetical protein